MALRRSTRSVDGTIPVPALLYNDEELLASQDSVGIYDGSQKSTYHQNGGIHVTTHRLFYIDAQNEFRHSFALDLSSITQTEHYAGLFTSSAKVTLHLSAPESDAGSTDNNNSNNSANTLSPFDIWECQVCAYRNSPGLSPAASRICGLCGVPRASLPQSSQSSQSSASPTRINAKPSSTASRLQLSTSLPPTPPRPRSPPSASPPHLGSQDPASDDTSNSIACPACTFLNHPSLRTCEMCSTELPKIRPPANRSRLDMRSAPTSRPTSPIDDGSEDSNVTFIKISFRRGGDKPFYAVLKRSLKAKAWAITSAGAKVTADSSTLTRDSLARSGISGIMRTVEDTAQHRQTGISDALQDLEALMVKAKDMVRLAAELNEKLTNASKPRPTDVFNSPGPSSGASTPSTYSLAGSTTSGIAMEPEEATFIRSSLSQLGLQMVNAPLTQDMVRDERKWIEELAIELANILQGTSSSLTASGGLMKERPVIALDEVWGGWNRARGVALIPPSTFLQVLPHLPSHTTPSINIRTFSSGLSVLHTPSYGSQAFSKRVCNSLKDTTIGKTTMEVALEEKMTVGLIGEMLAEVEKDGGIVRDDGNMAIVGGGSGVGVGTALVSEEMKWWVNVFVEYMWDGYVHPVDVDEISV